DSAATELDTVLHEDLVAVGGEGDVTAARPRADGGHVQQPAHVGRGVEPHLAGQDRDLHPVRVGARLAGCDHPGTRGHAVRAAQCPKETVRYGAHRLV